MFERELGWTGLCIEPNPDVFPLLIKNRSAVCIQTAIAKRDGRLPFIKAQGYAQMLSGGPSVIRATSLLSGSCWRGNQRG
jgi:hypothetical protein